MERFYKMIAPTVAGLLLGGLCACSRTPDNDAANASAAKGAVMASSEEEDCEAPDSWFAGREAPKPLTSEPKQGDDCAFYQRAWQQFLYATDGTANAPRFASFDTYTTLFGADRRLGLLPAQVPHAAFAANAHPLVLAPRLEKSAQAAQAEDVLQAGSSAILIDQNGHPIFYSIFINPDFASLIRTRHYNDAKILPAVGAEEELPPGIVEYKAAWQIVDPASPPQDRITVAAEVPWLIADPLHPGKLKVDTTRPLRGVTVALIALHVVFLPKNHPEMVWATFEYDRNAPSLKGNPVAPGGAATCPNAADPKDETVADDGKPYLLYRNGVAFKDANARPKALTVVDAQAQTFSPSASIVRSFPFSGCAVAANQPPVNKVDPAIVSLNGHAKGKLASRKWLAGYSLIGAVWQDAPRSADPTMAFKSNKIFPDNQLGGEDRLSSTSMESFTQTSSPNCFSCHDTQSKGNLDPKRISVSHVFRRFALGSH